jgi:hypothetical protein
MKLLKFAKLLIVIMDTINELGIDILHATNLDTFIEDILLIPSMCIDLKIKNTTINRMVEFIHFKFIYLSLYDAIIHEFDDTIKGKKMIRKSIKKLGIYLSI